MPTPRRGAAWPLLRRAGACLVDLAIVAAIGGSGSKLLALALCAAGLTEAFCESARKLAALGAHGAYCVLLNAGPARSTWGQRWFGLELAGADGLRPSGMEAFARWLAFLAAALPLGVGLILGLGREGRPFQDRLCDSRITPRAAPAERKAT